MVATGEGIERLCRHCGGIFLVRYRTSTKTYCSPTCALSGRTGRVQQVVQARWRSFEAARAYVRALGLANLHDWHSYCRSGHKPADIPACPHQSYRGNGWTNYGDFLGTARDAFKGRTYLSFASAREATHQAQPGSIRAYKAWLASGSAPKGMPSHPDRVYAGAEWCGWGDYLGTGRAYDWGPFRPFGDARVYMRSLQLDSKADYDRWNKRGSRPRDIPANPDKAYAAQWCGWGDYLGYRGYHTRPACASFVRSLLPVLPGLQPAELYALLRERGMLDTPAGQRWSTDLTAALNELLADAGNDGSAQRLLERLASPDAPTACAAPSMMPPAEQQNVVVPSAAAVPTVAATATDILEATEGALAALRSAPPDLVDFLIASGVAKLWALCFARDSAAPALTELAGYRGGEYAERVRDRFMEQWNGAARIQPPHGYRFGKPPLLMQRLVAHRLKTERRLGNWSAPGAGKTLGAILASRVVDSRLTVIVAANNTLEGWEHEIRASWPDSAVLKKERGTLAVDAAQHTCLLLNYEAFQQPASAAMVERLASEQHIDMLVLDEVHNIKQRGVHESKRRRVLRDLLEQAGSRNPGLHVLGMSATPVINSLDEGASLLAMILGLPQYDLETAPSIANAIGLHERLVVHGVRYRPHYASALREQPTVVDGTRLACSLAGLPRGRVLALEQALLGAKLDAIAAAARQGTVVYTHYVDGMVEPLRERLEREGWRVAEFTGRNKRGLQQFKAGEADVLIGSACLREGIDGLQKVSNRVIIASLPWTHAAYEQLLGRFWRQGSAFEREGVDVIIPQVVIGDEAWSWDRTRMERVRLKKTLADAALDGVIPQDAPESEQTMLQRSMQALRDWIAQLERDDSAA